MISNTSLMAFDMIQNDLGNRQLQVYEGFKKLEYSTSAMKGLIERSHISRCAITKNTAQYWKLKLLHNNLNKTGGINGKNR